MKCIFFHCFWYTKSYLKIVCNIFAAFILLLIGMCNKFMMGEMIGDKISSKTVKCQKYNFHSLKLNILFNVE